MTSDVQLSTPPGRRAVAVWLWVCVAALLAMIVLGGVVRLTRSGLSITVWDPILGAIPPLNHADWEHAFSLYKKSPEFQWVNGSMDLEGFKSIFWLEYFHRLLGRSIGLVIALPCAVFLWKRWLSRKVMIGLIVLLLLGALQGFFGWYMVASGLVGAPHVSHYRLTLHLGMALLILGYAVRLALGETFGAWRPSAPSRALRNAVTFTTGLVFVTMLSGGLMAGLKAGVAFPTFPFIAGKIIPDGLLAVEPAWRNVFDNALTVNFQHRVLATTVLVVVVALFVVSRRMPLARSARLGFELMLGFALLQVTLGIATLLLHTPVALAAMHQGNAALLFASTLYASFALRRAPAGHTTRAVHKVPVQEPKGLHAGPFQLQQISKPESGSQPPSLFPQVHLPS
jgi:heme a synthase